MGRQKAVIKARREAKRVLRRDSRSHKQREDESVTSLVQMGGVEAIGMARDSRDATPITARNEAQAQYLNAIESKQLIFATGEAGCGKTWISAAKAAEALIHKDVDRIIVTRPVLQADEDLGFLPGDVSEKFAPYFRPVYDVLVKRLGPPSCNIACGLRLVRWKSRHSPICVDAHLKMQWSFLTRLRMLLQHR